MNGAQLSAAWSLVVCLTLAGPAFAQEAAPPQEGAAVPAAEPEAAAPAEEKAPEAQAPEAGDLEATVRQADALYAKREATFAGPNIDQSIVLLEEAVKKHPGEFELLWRLARAYFWKSDGAPTSELKSSWGMKAMQYGDYARVRNPEDVRGHYFAALGVGSYSQGMGILSALTKGLEGKFNERLDKALAIDPKYDCGGPMNAKGRYYFELPWPKYKGKKSIEWLERSLAACPNSVRALYYLAETQLKEGEDAKAKANLQKAVSIDPASFEDPPEVRRARPWAQALLEKVE